MSNTALLTIFGVRSLPFRDPGPNLSDLTYLLSMRERVELFLSSAVQLSLIEQLNTRRVAAIYRLPFVPLQTSGRLYQCGDQFYIAVNEDCSLSDQSVTIGHELAHTFEPLFDPEYRRHVSAYLEPPEWPWIHQLCDDFAHRWLATSTVVQELEQLLQKPNSTIYRAGP